jgi:hypothetical protein
MFPAVDASESEDAKLVVPKSKLYLAITTAFAEAAIAKTATKLKINFFIFCPIFQLIPLQLAAFLGLFLMAVKYFLPLFFVSNPESNKTHPPWSANSFGVRMSHYGTPVDNLT